jgi:ribonuclease HI
VLLLLWRAWFLRNYIVHDKGIATIKQSVQFLKSYALEISLNQALPCLENIKGKNVASPTDCLATKGLPNKQNTWIKALQGCVKVNVDASFVQVDSQANVGVVAREENGNVCFSAARMLIDCSSAEEAELEAIRDGITLAATWTQGNVTCETDCLAAASAINRDGKDLSQLCHIINDIKDLLCSHSRVRVVHISRSCNRLAHCIATLARTCNTVGFWLGSVPHAVEPLLVEECNLDIG